MNTELQNRLANVNETINRLGIRLSNNDERLTDQYGYIEFHTDRIESKHHLPQYIHLALKTDAEKVVKFIQTAWSLPTPDLIISVAGGAKKFHMSPRLRNIFQIGLVDAAVTANAWIITAGTNAGAIQEVGEALNNYRYIYNKQGTDITCIGIGSWGYTADNTLLTISNLDDSKRIKSYTVKKSPKGQCHLEPNHTHFLLFDDGDQDADKVLPLRASIEMQLRVPRKTDPVKNERESALSTLLVSQSVYQQPATTLPRIDSVKDTLIPIVLILVEGGPSSVDTVTNALIENTPVVVLKESGRAADFVAYLYEYCLSIRSNDTIDAEQRSTSTRHANNKSQLSNDIWTEIKKNHSWIVNPRKPMKEAVLFKLYEAISEHLDFITVFNLNSGQYNGHLDDAILEAVLNASKALNTENQNYTQIVELKLAMAWNKFDYASKTILTDVIISKWSKDDLHHVLFDALRRGLADFVELLIELGASPADLTVGELEQLYLLASTGRGLPCRKAKTRHSRTKQQFYKAYSLQEPRDNQKQKTKKIALGEQGMYDLFVWAIFVDRFDLATYFCSKTWNPSIAPLIASWIYQIAINSTLNSELREDYQAKADEFDAHARGIIDYCFDNNNKFALKLLNEPIASFSNEHPLRLARKANCRQFIASPCAQRYLNNLWFGHINYRLRWIDFRVFLCTLLLPFIPFFAVALPYVGESHTRSKVSNSSLTNVDTINASLSLPGSLLSPLPDSIPWYKRFFYFYTAPVVRFYYDVIFSIAFLGLFSYVFLVDYYPLNIFQETRTGYYGLLLPVSEIVLHIFLWCIICEEIYQIVRKALHGEFITELWNMLTLVAIGLYIVGFITRFIVSEAVFAVSKIFMGLDLIVWYIRILHLFAAYERLGPKLEMIFKTMKDLLFFVCFIVIFLLGFSTTSWSLINSASQVNWTYTGNGQLVNVITNNMDNNLRSWQTLRDVINFGVWKIFGQVDSITGTDAYSNVVFVLAIIFVTIANVLLLNVLVALFNVTIQDVAKQSYVLWRYQRFLLVDEYQKRAPLPPPFNIICYIIMMIVYAFQKMICVRRLNAAVSVQNTLQNVSTDCDMDSQYKFEITDDMKRERAIVSRYWAKIFGNQKKDPKKTKYIYGNNDKELNELK